MALKGVKVIELAGLAPVPFCGMMLRDFGANVVRVDKPNTFIDADRMSRGKRSVIIDLKKPRGVETLRQMCNKTDVVIDPYRPGVLESLCLGPDSFKQSNPGLIFARISGYGQTGPYARKAGHDNNYVAVSGVLSMLGEEGRPPLPPMNLIADFAGGGLMCAFGIIAALYERTKSGKGQVVDMAMSEGASYVSTMLFRSRSPKSNVPIWLGKRGQNLLDGGVHFYNTYQTKDNKFITVGAIEPQFYESFIKKIGMQEIPQMTDFSMAKAKISECFLQKTLAEWKKIFDDETSCVMPVVDWNDVTNDLHVKARGSFISGADTPVPRPAPCLSRTPAEPDLLEPNFGQHTVEVLKEFDFSQQQIDSLIADKIVEDSNIHLKSNI